MLHTTINCNAAKNDLAEPTTSADFGCKLMESVRHKTLLG